MCARGDGVAQVAKVIEPMNERTRVWVAVSVVIYSVSQSVIKGTEYLNKIHK